MIILSLSLSYGCYSRPDPKSNPAFNEKALADPSSVLSGSEGNNSKTSRNAKPSRSQ